MKITINPLHTARAKPSKVWAIYMYSQIPKISATGRTSEFTNMTKETTITFTHTQYVYIYSKRNTHVCMYVRTHYNWHVKATIIFLEIYFTSNYGYMCVIYVCVHMCISAHRSQKMASDLRELVTGSCAPPNMGTGHWTRSTWKGSKWAISWAPQP